MRWRRSVFFRRFSATALSRGLSFRSRFFFVLGNRLCPPGKYGNFFCVSSYERRHFFFPLSLHSSPAYINSTPMIKFWARGSSTAWLGLAYAVGQMPTAGINGQTVHRRVFRLRHVISGNAKFNLIGEKLDVKYRCTTCQSANGFVDRFRDSRERGLIRYRRQTSETWTPQYSFFLSLSLFEERSDEVKVKEEEEEEEEEEGRQIVHTYRDAMEGKLTLSTLFTSKYTSVLVYSTYTSLYNKIASWDR